MTRILSEFIKRFKVILKDIFEGISIRIVEGNSGEFLKNFIEKKTEINEIKVLRNRSMNNFIRNLWRNFKRYPGRKFTKYSLKNVMKDYLLKFLVQALGHYLMKPLQKYQEESIDKLLNKFLDNSLNFDRNKAIIFQ